MKSLLALSFIGCFAAGCASQPASYTEHDPRIVGTWSGASLEADYIGYGEKTYFPDGNACGFIIDDSVFGTEIVFYKSHWKIEDGKLISIEYSNTDKQGFLRVGDVIVDEIKAVTPSKMSLKETDVDGIYFRYKVPEDRGDTLCNLKEVSPGSSP